MHNKKYTFRFFYYKFHVLIISLMYWYILNNVLDGISEGKSI